MRPLWRPRSFCITGVRRSSPRFDSWGKLPLQLTSSPTRSIPWPILTMDSTGLLPSCLGWRPSSCSLPISPPPVPSSSKPWTGYCHVRVCGWQLRRGLLQKRRRALHTCLLEVVERLYAVRLTGQVGRLAHHALRGVLTIKSICHLSPETSTPSSNLVLPRTRPRAVT